MALPDFAIPLDTIQPGGSLTCKFIGTVTRLRNDSVTTLNGKPAYAYFIDDGGGFELYCTDKQGNTYAFDGSRYLDERTILATEPFDATLRARVRRGSTDTGWVSDGDYYTSYTAQQFSVSAFRAELRWSAL